VELGVQSIFDDVLFKNNRGHGIEASIEASKLLKDAGFKINYTLCRDFLDLHLKKII